MANSGRANLSQRLKYMDIKLIKHVKTQPFVMIPNMLAQREHNNLSLEAKGLLVDLLSRPPAWKIIGSYFMDLYKIGRDKFYNITKELQEKQYLYIEDIRDESTGQYIERKWHIYTEPAEFNNEEGDAEVQYHRSPGEPNLINNIDSKEYTEKYTKKENKIVSNSDFSKNAENQLPITNDIELPKRESNKDFAIDSDPYILGSHIIDCVAEYKNTYTRYLKSPEGREALIQNQAYYIDLIIRIDKHTPEEILFVFDWVQTSTFWKPNILSAYKLRTKWDRLCKAMQEAGYVLPVEDPNAELTAQVVEAYKALTNAPDFIPSAKKMISFIQASKRAVKFFEGRNINQKNWIKYLTNCLEKRYINSSSTFPIYPGTMCSDNTWEILMPQYLQEVGLV